MSTKSRRRAARRHPELTDEGQAAEAIGASILTLVTLGLVDPSEDTSPVEEAPASRTNR
jgi:hypothetical protein